VKIQSMNDKKNGSNRTGDRGAAYKDESLSIVVRVADLVSRMTLAEKVSQMTHNAPAIPRLDVPQYNWWNECLHGVARAGLATVFPQAIGMAASFDIQLMHQVAAAISDEARAKHHLAVRQGNLDEYLGLTYWSPNINIFRDPRWGRGQETYGECPYLTARIAVTFVKGMQGNDPKYLKLVATPKHYAVHSGPEPLRHEFNALVSKKDLFETYLPAFKACIQEAGAASIMGAYNRTNGEPCCASRTLLQNILRGQWDFDGYVVSDCGAINDIHQYHKVTKKPSESAAMAVRNGCDLNCGEVYPHLLEAVEEGLITEEEIDVAVTRLFQARFRLGLFDDSEQVSYAQIGPEVIHCRKHRDLARQMARESIVLLKNEENLLPLRKDLKAIALIGPAIDQIDVLQGNYCGISSQMTTMLEGVVGAVSPGTRVMCAQGLSDNPVDEWWLEYALNMAEIIIAVLGSRPADEGEENAAQNSVCGGDRADIAMPPDQEKLIETLLRTGKPVVLVLTGGSSIACRLASERVPAILMAWYPGEAGGNAVADILFGDYCPSGRLPVTFYASLDQVPEFNDYSMIGRTYRYLKDTPLYPFGFGLSYTQFEYDNLRLSTKEVKSGETVAVRVDVTNIGDRTGDEVVQLYLVDDENPEDGPYRQLSGFERITLTPGTRKTVSFTLTPHQMARVDEEGRYVVKPRRITISAGGSQPDPKSRNLGAPIVQTALLTIYGNEIVLD
jgi:beta-glucosidase